MSIVRFIARLVTPTSAAAALVSALLATAAVLPFAAVAVKQPSPYRLEVKLSSSVSGRAQVFYDVGRGFNEADSFIHPVAAGTELTKLSFPLPYGTLHALRLDPIDRPAQIVVGRVRLVDAPGHAVETFPTSSIALLNELAVASSADGTVKLTTTEPGTDPSLAFHLPSPLELKFGLSLQIRHLRVGWSVLFISLWIGMLALTRDRAKRLQGAVLAARRRPVTALALVALLAVLLQCHPVVFLGRSFVSPNNGSPYLYESFPTVPGSTDATVEDTRGSDVAAMFHQTLYFPSIQREAIFDHHEWPLWNRYFTCGLPNLGQGQSLFGSLLNFIPVIGNGSSASWDIRFLLNRWLYAFGVGVTVWLLTRSLRAAALLAFGSVFIGFFGFRINHMAQFSLESTPWILAGWLLLRETRTRREILGALSVLALGCWEVLNSGTVKEAYMLLAAANLAGVLMLFTSKDPLGRRLARFGYAVAAGGLVLLIAAPWFTAFYAALRTSHTASDQITVQQASLRHLLGFFDDIFYSRIMGNEWRYLPSANFLVLVGLGWALVRAREAARDSAFLVLSAAALVAAALAFGIVPASWIVHVPGLRNVGHFHNTFSCVLIAFALPLAGCGLAAGLRCLERPGCWRRCVGVASVLAAVAGWYFFETREHHASAFVGTYSSALGLGVAACLLSMAAWERLRSPGILVVGCAGSIILFTWRHAQYLQTPFDPYVFNPHARVDLHARSEAVHIVSHRLQAGPPARVAGIGLNMLAGPNQAYGWEGIYGVDAVRSPTYDGLLAVAGVNKLFWPVPDMVREYGGKPDGWHEDDFARLQPIHDLLNVRYYLGTRGAAVPTGLTRVASADLDVYESPSSWPRAFFTDQVQVYQDPASLVQRLRFSTDRRPSAAMLPQDRDQIRDVLHPPTGPRTVVAGRDYAFTSNTTTFTVTAPGPGVVVLAETYYPEDFRATLNGTRVPYVRVNHTFKAVAVPAAGTYRVSFAYRPRFFTLSLWLFGAGLAGTIGGALWLWRSDPRAQAVRAEPV